MPHIINVNRRTFGAMLLASTAGCARRVPVSNPREEFVPKINFMEGYGPLLDGEYSLPGIPDTFTQGINRRITGEYLGEQDGGTIDVDPFAKCLYNINSDGTAVRYPVGVGRQGRSINGGATIKLKREWPGWTPTQNMLRTEPEVYGPFASGVPGGLKSPLGSRALYLFRDGRDTYYRIHGTNDLGSIGNSGSAGCIRMFNQDIIHLYEQVVIPTKVHIRSREESQRVDPENYERGVELPPKIISREELFGENEPDPDDLDLFTVY